MAQNGGQYAENNFGKLVYSGYSNGHYVLDCTNKQTCGVDFHFTWLDEDTTIYIPQSSTVIVHLPCPYIGNLNIKCKPLYKCGGSGGDMGWLEVTSPLSLPVKFKSITTERISGTEFWVNFSIADPVNVKQYNIQTSADGITWHTSTILWPDQRTNYSIKLNLTSK